MQINGVKKYSISEIEKMGEDSLKKKYGISTIEGNEHLEDEILDNYERSEPGDLCVIIYTSGTTGDPKGVMLTHHNILTNAIACQNTFHTVLDENVIAFSILPWAHSYGFVAELMNGIIFGGSVGLMDTMDTVVEDIAKVRPTHIIGVPLIFNRIHAGIYQQLLPLDHRFRLSRRAVDRTGAAFDVWNVGIVKRNH